jgi:hypothetical protein
MLWRRSLDRRCERILSASHDAQEWESHQPVLAGLLQCVPKARVLELGIGYGSTPLVVCLSGHSVSLETKRDWYRKFARYASAAHAIELFENYDEWEWRCPYFNEDWDIAFVDNAPGRSRQSNLEKLAERSRFIVCHDTEEVFKPSPSDYRWDFSGFEHVWTCTLSGTYTTVVSRSAPLPAELHELPGIFGLQDAGR